MGQVAAQDSFDMMNTINASTGFSGFQLRLGRSPRLIPPLVLERLLSELAGTTEAERARVLIEKMENDTAKAGDRLWQAKVNQAHHTNKSQAAEDVFAVGDRVMLSTVHQHREYAKKGEKCSAKFFPHFDGLYDIIDVHPETTNYMLDLPNSNTFPTFHSSLLKCFVVNDADLFPSRETSMPGPIMMDDGLEEYFMDSIIDSQRCGRGWQFLVRWTGYGPEHDAGSRRWHCKSVKLSTDGTKGGEMDQR
jgi:hypothetical protein